MSVLSSFPLLWSQQVPLGGLPSALRGIVSWLLIFGEPTLTIPGLVGGLITWAKIVSLFCLLGWVVSWLTAAFKERIVAQGGPLDIAALVADDQGNLAPRFRKDRLHLSRDGYAAINSALARALRRI